MTEPTLDLDDPSVLRQLLPDQLAALRSHFSHSLYAFAYTVCGFTKLHPSIHSPVCDLFERWGTTPTLKRVMVQLPRGAFKSSVITIAGSLWLLVNDPNRTIAIFNETLDNAKRFLGSIESIVRRSRLFALLWPELLPPGVAPDDNRSTPKSWPFNSERLLLARPRINEPEVSITAMGAGGASAGHHFTHIIMDDLISEDAANSPTVMQYAKDWLDTSIYLGPSPEELNSFIVCTRWHFDDVYEYARKHHGYKLYRRGALEDGHSICESMWTTDALLREQESRPYTFASQMLNVPSAGKTVSFQSEWRRRASLTTDPASGDECVEIHADDYSPRISALTLDDPSLELDGPPPRRVPLHSLTKTLLVDPAPATETDRKREPNARTALVLKAIDAWGRRYLLDLWAGREEPVENCRRMIRMAMRWGTTRIAIEEVVFSKVFAPFLRYIADREFRAFHLHYIPLAPGRRDKDTRIQGLIPSYEAGFEYQLTTVRALHGEEYLTYPYSPTRDILDAEAYCLDPGVLSRPQTPYEFDMGADDRGGVGVGGWDESRCEVTGY